MVEVSAESAQDDKHYGHFLYTLSLQKRCKGTGKTE